MNQLQRWPTTAWGEPSWAILTGSKTDLTLRTLESAGLAPRIWVDLGELFQLLVPLFPHQRTGLRVVPRWREGRGHLFEVLSACPASWECPRGSRLHDHYCAPGTVQRLPPGIRPGQPHATSKCICVCAALAAPREGHGHGPGWPTSPPQHPPPGQVGNVPSAPTTSQKCASRHASPPPSS